MQTTPSDSAANAAQVEYWNSTVAETWVQYQAQLDAQIGPLGQEAMRVLAPVPGERLLDIGCGCGQTTAELAARVSPTGSVLGVDISVPMLEVARSRRRPFAGMQVEFRRADAQSEDLGEASFDAAFSRFGVMFFSDPVAAFANVARALKPRSRLVFVCWQPFEDNVWIREPLDAARPVLPPLPVPDPTAPGPFAFANPERLRTILRDAGFESVAIDPFETRVGGFSVEQTLGLTLRMGPLGSALRENPTCEERVSAAVRPVLARYLTSGGVLMPAAVWIAQARTAQARTG